MKVLLLFCLFLLVRHVHAEDGTAPGLFTEQPNGTELIPMKSSHADCSISGPIAHVTLTQVYTNQGTAALNARYLFPASTGAAVHGMSFTLNGKTTRALIKRREEARKDFEAAKAVSKSAGLLEQQRPNIFSMEVATLLPGDQIQIEITYSEVLAPVDSYYEFHIPTAIGPRYSSPAQTAADPVIASNPYLEGPAKGPSRTTFSSRVNISSPLPIQTLTCPSHPTADVSFTSENEASVELPTCAPDRDFILRYRLAGDQILAGTLVHPPKSGKDTGTLLLHMEAPTEVSPEQIPPRNITFVIDTSGSMAGFPLSLAKSILQDLCGQLKVSDTFNILQFAGSSHSLSEAPLAVSPEHLRQGVAFINSRRSGGGTELKSALSRAFELAKNVGEDHSNTVVILTDGFITAEDDVFRLIREQGTGLNIIPIGVGSSVNRHLMNGLSQFSSQAPFVITSASDLKEARERFLVTAGQPVLTNIRLKGNGITLEDRLPSSQPDLFVGTPLSLLAHFTATPDFSGTPSVIVEGTMGNGQSYSRAFNVSSEEGSSPKLPLLWAREKVRELADYSTLFNDEETREQVTLLGLEHQLLTPYTSFVAVAEEARPASGQSSPVTQALPLPHNTSFPASGSVPEPGPTALLVLTILSLVTLRRR